MGSFYNMERNFDWSQVKQMMRLWDRIITQQMSLKLRAPARAKNRDGNISVEVKKEVKGEIEMEVVHAGDKKEVEVDIKVERE
jgi:hypothetical protein